jgi:hypothetical protein
VRQQKFMDLRDFWIGLQIFDHFGRLDLIEAHGYLVNCGVFQN